MAKDIGHEVKGIILFVLRTNSKLHFWNEEFVSKIHLNADSLIVQRRRSFASLSRKGHGVI